MQFFTSREVDGVFQVRTAQGIGTAFLYWQESGGCLVSAAHLFDGIMEGERIHLRKADGGWHWMKVAEVAISASGYDVAAVCLQNFVASQNLLPYAAPEAALGDEVRFLGFPHGLLNTYPSNTGLATPLVRKASFSGIIKVGEANLMILDGFNNPGYSGAPVYWRATDGCRLFGVISGYKHERREHSRVYKSLPDGTEEEVADLYVKPNSGMIYASGVGEILKVASTLHNLHHAAS